MSRKHLQQLIKSLRELDKCPSCGANYFLDDLKFLGEAENQCFVQLCCHECALPLLATVSDGQASINLPADLSQTEEDDFSSKGEITADEIAEFHQFISSFKGRLKLT